jgi:hypothetical protein
MRYNATGIDTATGMFRSVCLDADSPDAARSLARGLGFRATNVELAPRDAGDFGPSSASPRAGGGAPRAQNEEADWFKIAAWANGLVALACLVTGLAQMLENKESGLLIIAMSLYFGFASVVTLVGLSKGIKLAREVKAELADIRARLPES